VANRYWVSEPDSWGGRWRLNANLLNIVREVGTQTRRLSLGSVYDKSFRDGIGGQYRFTASLRGDAYSVNDLSNKSNPELPSSFFSQTGMPPLSPISYNFLTGRAFPQLGMTWSYPLVHRSDDITATIEPMTGVFAGPAGGNQRRIPNEDSLGFEFRDSDLFRPDRLAGYEVLDTGQPVDYGLRFGANYLLLAPQQQSELVTNPIGQNILFGKREQITFSTVAKLTRYWSLTGSETLNLTNSTNFINGIPTPQSNNTSLYATVAG